MPHQTRGNDSAQHRYLVTRIAAAIPGAQVELTLGTKSIDIVIPFKADEHHDLAAVLREHGVTPNAHDLLAIEVERSPTKTLANNLLKNTAAGIALNIIAVLPEQLATAREIAAQLSAPERRA